MCSDVYTFVELSKWANVYMKMVVYIHVKYGEYEPCFNSCRLLSRWKQLQRLYAKTDRGCTGSTPSSSSKSWVDTGVLYA